MVACAVGSADASGSEVCSDSGSVGSDSTGSSICGDSEGLGSEVELSWVCCVTGDSAVSWAAQPESSRSRTAAPTISFMGRKTSETVKDS